MIHPGDLEDAFKKRKHHDLSYIVTTSFSTNPSISVFPKRISFGKKHHEPSYVNHIETMYMLYIYIIYVYIYI